MADRIMVAFEGTGAGEGELTWGQQHIWGAMQALGESMNMCAARPLPPGATVAEFVDELRYYVSRFAAMRTLVRFAADGRPRQVVLGAGEAPLEVLDLADGDDPAEAAAKLVAEQEQTPFDLTTELPIRMLLLRHRGGLTHLVTVLSHFATDGGGGFAMYTDFVNRATGPVPLQPLELAARQATPAGRRQSDAALAYWKQHLRALPPRRDRPPADPDGPRYWQLEVASRALRLAVRAIAARTQVDERTVLLALTNVAVARVTGAAPVVTQLLVSNRFRPGLSDIVSNVAQTGLCVVDLSGCTVDEAVARTRRASLAAYKHAYFDVLRWKAMLAARPDADLGYYYNDRPGAPNPPDGEETALAEPRWTSLDYFNERLMVTIDDHPSAVALLVLADTHAHPRAEMAALARELEEVAVAAAADPLTPVTAPAPVR